MPDTVITTTNLVLFLGGIFNIVDPIFQQPIYIYSFFALPFLAVLIYAGFHFISWVPMKPLHGLYYAMKNGSNVAFIFNADLWGELVSERDAKCIFDYSREEVVLEPDEGENRILWPIKRWITRKMFYYPTLYLDNLTPNEILFGKLTGVNKDVEIAMHLEGERWERPAAFVCAGVPAEIIIDRDRWTIKNSEQHRIIVQTAMQWNDDHPKDQIHSYAKFQRYLSEGKMPVPAGISPTGNIPWQRIDAAFPLALNPNAWAGKIRQMAIDMEKAMEGAINQWIPTILIVGVGFAFMIFIGRLVLAVMK